MLIGCDSHLCANGQASHPILTTPLHFHSFQNIRKKNKQYDHTFHFFCIAEVEGRHKLGAKITNLFIYRTMLLIRDSYSFLSYSLLFYEIYHKTIFRVRFITGFYLQLCFLTIFIAQTPFQCYILLPLFWQAIPILSPLPRYASCASCLQF